MVLAAPQNTAQLKGQLESSDLRPLEILGPGNGATDHLSVVLDTCQHCRAFHAMSLTRVTIRRSKLGKPTISKTTIVQHLILGQGQAEGLRQLSEKMTQAAKLNPARANATAAGQK